MVVHEESPGSGQLPAARTTFHAPTSMTALPHIPHIPHIPHTTHFSPAPPCRAFASAPAPAPRPQPAHVSPNPTAPVFTVWLAGTLRVAAPPSPRS